MEGYIADILQIYNNQVQLIATMNHDLQDIKNNNAKLIETLEQANEKISVLTKDIKLKDSRIAAYERSSSITANAKNVIKQDSEFAKPEIPRPKSPVREEIPQIEAPINEDYVLLQMDNSADEELHKLNERYYLEVETRDLYNISEDEKVGTQVGQLKTFKTKAGLLYILNSYTNRVYNTNEDNEVLNYCGNLLNKKLKLL
jgi:hypothetical protein